MHIRVSAVTCIVDGVSQHSKVSPSSGTEYPGQCLF
jgi:hypothetical protein